jgi:excisionase family DNA binding protein
VHAVIRRYRVDRGVVSEVIRQITEDFAPLIERSPGIVGYYVVVDAQDGAFATVTICEHQAAIEASNKMAAAWMQRYLSSKILGQEKVPAFSLEVQEPLQGPLYIGVSETPASQGARMLSVRDVCEELGMGKSWVYQRIRSGEIPSVRLGGSVKVKREDLEGYLEKHRRYEIPDEESPKEE